MGEMLKIFLYLSGGNSNQTFSIATNKANTSIFILKDVFKLCFRVLRLFNIRVSIYFKQENKIFLASFDFVLKKMLLFTKCQLLQLTYLC